MFKLCTSYFKQSASIFLLFMCFGLLYTISFRKMRLMCRIITWLSDMPSLKSVFKLQWRILFTWEWLFIKLKRVRSCLYSYALYSRNYSSYCNNICNMGMLEASKWLWNSWGKFKQFGYPSELLLNSLILLLFINLLIIVMKNPSQLLPLRVIL